MKGIHHVLNGRNTSSIRANRGIALVEFSLIGLLFFMLLFGVIEVGRLMLTLNLLDHTTRVAARLAAVCPTTENNIVKQQAESINLPDFGSQNITIKYLDELLNPMDPTDDDEFDDITFVSAEITGYSHRLLIPGVDINVSVPNFRTLIPSESLGVLPVVDASITNYSCSPTSS